MGMSENKIPSIKTVSAAHDITLEAAKIIFAARNKHYDPTNVESEIIVTAFLEAYGEAENWVAKLTTVSEKR
jgi:hypothetical protein